MNTKGLKIDHLSVKRILNQLRRDARPNRITLIATSNSLAEFRLDTDSIHHALTVLRFINTVTNVVMQTNSRSLTAFYDWLFVYDKVKRPGLEFTPGIPPRPLIAFKAIAAPVLTTALPKRCNNGAATSFQTRSPATAAPRSNARRPS